MKILQINAVYKIGSTGRCIAEFQEYILNHTIHNCKSVFSYGGIKSDGFIVGNKMDRNIHGLLSRLSGKQAHFSRTATEKLLVYIKEYSPDVIVLRNLHGNFIHFPLLMRYIASANIPTVYVLDDCWPFTGKCCHYISDSCLRWQMGCGDCPRLKKDNPSFCLDKTRFLWGEKRILYGRIPRLAFVGVSKWVADEAKKSPLTAQAKEILYIYNGIDENIFYDRGNSIREKYGLQNRKILLSVASIWSNAKGLGYIIDLSKRLPKECTVVLIGALSAELPDNIIHILATSDANELAEWYSAADVYINMSKEETFGRVSAEALSCGTPVVCFPTTANPELVGEGCGMVCRTEKQEDYLQCVLIVLQNGKGKYKESCLAFARERFNKTKCFEQYLELFERLLQIDSTGI